MLRRKRLLTVVVTGLFGLAVTALTGRLVAGPLQDDRLLAAAVALVLITLGLLVGVLVLGTQEILVRLRRLERETKGVRRRVSRRTSGLAPSASADNGPRNGSLSRIESTLERLERRVVNLPDSEAIHDTGLDIIAALQLFESRLDSVTISLEGRDSEEQAHPRSVTQLEDLLPLEQAAGDTLRSLEALFNLSCLLAGHPPLPYRDDYAIDLPTVNFLSKFIIEGGVTSIIETGSGVSTIVIAACLRLQGGGHLVTLEHSSAYADRTRRWLELYDLADYAEVIHSPLEPRDLYGQRATWYGVDIGELPSDVELLFVGGPPRPAGEMAHWPALPALPALLNCLTPGATVLVDDTSCADAERVFDAWAALPSVGRVETIPGVARLSMLKISDNGPLVRR